MRITTPRRLTPAGHFHAKNHPEPNFTFIAPLFPVCYNQNQERTLRRGVRRNCSIKNIDMEGKFVAIKMHFGELGNLAYLRPNYAKVVADLCKEQGGLPFLTDCNTLYPGSRKNALEHLTCAQLNGFWPMTTGCQVIIADGLRGTDEVEVPVPNGEYCKTAKIGRAIMDADIFISLSHFKGHESTGFGGAIKNIGMGCGSRAGKMEQHASGHPAVQEDLCRGCHRCAKECGSDAISYNEKNKAVIDQDKCKGCGRCIGACNFDAIYAQCDSANEMLDRKMAEYAAAVCHDRPTFHISLVQDISPNCDCHGENDAPILPDIGMFASFDPVALDQACADACLNAAPLPNSQLGQNLATPGWNCHHDNFKDSNPNIEWKATPSRPRRSAWVPAPTPSRKSDPDKTKAGRLPHQSGKASALFCDLILALCLRHEGVNDILEGIPVLLREGQLLGVEAHVLQTACHGVLVFQQGSGIVLYHGPCLGEALLLRVGEVVVPLGVGVLNGCFRAGREVCLCRPRLAGWLRPARS